VPEHDFERVEVVLGVGGFAQRGSGTDVLSIALEDDDRGTATDDAAEVGQLPLPAKGQHVVLAHVPSRQRSSAACGPSYCQTMIEKLLCRTAAA
jgi:hypothetical protein